MLGRYLHVLQDRAPAAYGLDIEPESKEAGINAILGRDVLGKFKIIPDRPGCTGTMELCTGACGMDTHDARHFPPPPCRPGS